jgi:hypothetical protein
MGDPESHIAEWEGAGLIDAVTAANLRAVTRATTPAAAPEPGDDVARAAAMFGPSVTIAEIFGYLGSGFLLAAWTALLGRFGGEVQSRSFGIGALVAAIVLIGLGFLLQRGDSRRRRAAGVAFMVAVAYVAIGMLALLGGRFDDRVSPVVATGAALLVAIAIRRWHAAVLTQVGMLGAITTFAAAALGLAESIVRPAATSGFEPPRAIEPADVALVVAGSAWWLVTAVAIGVVALQEERRAGVNASATARRVAVTRFWAGATAVLGLLSMVTRRILTPGDNFDRVVPAWIGELAIVVVCLVLLERAFRRDATSFVYAAAIGLIAALSDFNFTYLSNSTEVALGIEGAILLAVGLGADRLRRRLRSGPAIT